MPGKLGILAGGGDLPRRLVEACRSSGRPYFVIAIKDQADPQTVVDAPHAWVRLGAADTALRIAREQGIEEIVMAGRVHRPTLASLRPDGRALRVLARAGKGALGDDGLLRAVVREIEALGFTVVGPDTVLDGLVVSSPGAVGRCRADESARRDIARGIDVLRALGPVDVGQAVVVQEGIVLGVEAVEGTDALIDRCAGLQRDGPGGILVKIRKPGQETRVDLPTIGPGTAERAARAGLRGIAIEAGGTLVVDREELRRIADAAGIFVEAIAIE